MVGCTPRNAFEKEKPSDLYYCENSNDCGSTFRNIKTNNCCDSEIINKKYIQWYNENALEIVKCEHTCPISLLPDYICEQNVCNIL